MLTSRLFITFTVVVALVCSPTRADAQQEPTNDVPRTARAEDAPPPPPPSPEETPVSSSVPVPFGSRLFMGNFTAQRSERQNPDYMIAPGDRVSVNTWGSIEINDVFVVDGQGNIFLPQVGPVQLAGVRNADLTQAVRERIQQVYGRNVDIYTNLLTAAPVMVYVTGQVVEPGRYAGHPSDSVLFFLDDAGGIEPETGSYRNVQVLRDGNVIATLDLYDFLLTGSVPNVQLADGDSILVGPRGPTVTVEGDVAIPLIVEFDSPSFTGADALQIVRKATLATEITVRGMRRGIAAAHTLSVDEFADLPLRDGDVVTVRQDRRNDSILITLEGEFEGPSVISVRRGARLVDVLNHIPVREDLADTSAIHIKRRSVALTQKKAIDDSLFRLEKVALLTLSQSNGEADIRLKEAELMKQFIASARLIQPLGRVVTSKNGHQSNALLEDGDIIVIPRKTNVIQVGGEVQMTHAVLYRPDFDVGDYVRLAGGFSNRADKKRVLVLHADASVSMGDSDMEVRPGDQVLVSPKYDSKRLQNTMDVVQVVYQIAVAAGVAIAPIISATNN